MTLVDQNRSVINLLFGVGYGGLYGVEELRRGGVAMHGVSVELENRVNCEQSSVMRGYSLGLGTLGDGYRVRVKLMEFVRKGTSYREESITINIKLTIIYY